MKSTNLAFNLVLSLLCIIFFVLSSCKTDEPANLPTVTTVLSVTDITATTAKAGGSVTDDKGLAIISKGTCWSTSPTPTIQSNTKTLDGSGKGDFVSILTGLTSGTIYYVRAYCTYSSGTVYGNEISFTTSTTLTQPKVSKTINVRFAGELSTLLSTSEKSTITDLTVTGIIDARDVKWLRDKITNLSFLDLSLVTIQAYTGTGGTANISGTYPSNEMPESSFYDPSNFSGNNTLKSVLLPNSITSIGKYAFDDCRTLISIPIPNLVKLIGDGAFWGCEILSNVVLPNTVTSIGYRTFAGCAKIQSLTIPTSVITIKEGAFMSTGITNITIPNSVTTIGQDAFSNCGNLTSANLLCLITVLDNSIFRNCTSLKNVTIPNTVTSFGNYCFDRCPNLTSFVIPNSVVSIGYNVFYSCSGLKSITIGKSVTSIGQGAFSGCSGLTSIYAYPTTPVILSSSSPIFDNVNKSTCRLYVPSASLSAYQVAIQWRDFYDIVKM